MNQRSLQSRSKVELYLVRFGTRVERRLDRALDRGISFAGLQAISRGAKSDFGRVKYCAPGAE